MDYEDKTSCASSPLCTVRVNTCHLWYIFLCTLSHFSMHTLTHLHTNSARLRRQTHHRQPTTPTLILLFLAAVFFFFVGLFCRSLLCSKIFLHPQAKARTPTTVAGTSTSTSNPLYCSTLPCHRMHTVTNANFSVCLGAVLVAAPCLEKTYWQSSLWMAHVFLPQCFVCWECRAGRVCLSRAFHAPSDVCVCMCVVCDSVCYVLCCVLYVVCCVLCVVCCVLCVVCCVLCVVCSETI